MKSECKIVAVRFIGSAETLININYTVDDIELANIIVTDHNDQKRGNIFIYADEHYNLGYYRRKQMFELLFEHGLYHILRSNAGPIRHNDISFDDQVYIKGAYENAVDYLIKEGIKITDIKIEDKHDAYKRVRI